MFDPKFKICFSFTLNKFRGQNRISVLDWRCDRLNTIHGHDLIYPYSFLTLPANSEAIRVNFQKIVKQ